MSKEAKPAADAAPKKGSKKLIIIAAAAVALLAGGGGGAYVFLGKHKEADAAAADEHKAEKKVEKKAPVFVNLDPFTVNLQDEDGGHYLQVGIVLEASDAAMVEQIKVQMPVIRNRILLLLSSKRAEELLTLKGKQALAEEIANESRQPLGIKEKGIEGVYFASFVIQ
jgi:flagellar protein FliL